MAGPAKRRRSRLPLLTVGFLLLGGLALVIGAGPGTSSRPAPSGGVAAATATPAASLAPLAAPARGAPPGREVYGFVPYWEMDAGIVDHVAATDLTTVALFSVTHRPDGSLNTRANGYRRVTGEVGRRLVGEAHERGTPVEITWTSFGQAQNRSFFVDPAAQDRWLEVLTTFAVERGFDGINVDVEALPLELVPAWAAFVGRLREALRERNANARVTVSTQANQLGAAMALAATAAGADRIFLMGYDYRTARSAPGASAPLDRLDGEEKDLRWSLDGYAALGVPADRTLLGLPLYGVTWPVLGPEFGAAAVARGQAWVPRRNLAAFSDPARAPTLEPTESVEFFATGQGTSWRAVYYDSPRSLAPKLALAEERGLAGAGFWAIGYERGLPAYTEMIAAFRAGSVAEGVGS